jgi:hypothetical protein
MVLLLDGKTLCVLSTGFAWMSALPMQWSFASWKSKPTNAEVVCAEDSPFARE